MAVVETQRIWGGDGLGKLIGAIDPAVLSRAIAAMERALALAERIFPPPAPSAMAEPPVPGVFAAASDFAVASESMHALAITQTLANGERLRRLWELVQSLKGRVDATEWATIVAQLSALVANPSDFAGWIKFVVTLTQALASKPATA